MITEIITIYVIIDDLLKATGHRDNQRAQMSDTEVITAGGSPFLQWQPESSLHL